MRGENRYDQNGDGTVVRYADTVPMLLAAITMSGILCLYGHQGEYMMEVQSFPFVIVYGLFFCLSFGLLYYVSTVIKYMDRQRPWTADWGNRVLQQVLTAVVVPLAVIFLLQLLFTNILPHEIRSSAFLYTDMIIHGLTLLLINMSYTVCYYVVRYRRADAHIRLLEERRAATEQTLSDNAAGSVSPLPQLLDPKTELFIYMADNRIKKVSFDQVAYVYWKSKVGQVWTFDGEPLIATEQSSLIELHTLFKGYCQIINRNYMISQGAIAYCKKQKEGYIIGLKVEPSLQILISKKRFEELKDWILECVDIEVGN